MAKAAPKEKPRQTKDFNHMDLKPSDKDITDPDKIQIEGGVEYPKHLHRFSGLGNPHEFVEVNDAHEEAEQREEGFGSAQEADEEARQAKLDAEPPALKAKKAARKAAKK